MEMTTEDHMKEIKKHLAQSKMFFAISLIKNAECEEDVLDAVWHKEELNWQEVDEELKDQWYEYFGDAKKYLP